LDGIGEKARKVISANATVTMRTKLRDECAFSSSPM
jgi:hypothetical protein